MSLKFLPRHYEKLLIMVLSQATRNLKPRFFSQFRRPHGVKSSQPLNESGTINKPTRGTNNVVNVFVNLPRFYLMHTQSLWIWAALMITRKMCHSGKLWCRFHSQSKSTHDFHIFHCVTQSDSAIVGPMVFSPQRGRESGYCNKRSPNMHFLSYCLHMINGQKILFSFCALYTFFSIHPTCVLAVSNHWNVSSADFCLKDDESKSFKNYLAKEALKWRHVHFLQSPKHAQEGVFFSVVALGSSDEKPEFINCLHRFWLWRMKDNNCATQLLLFGRLLHLSSHFFVRSIIHLYVSNRDIFWQPF